ncbi:MAG: hypothetical protein ABEJ58_02760 [Halodesulfurarchaeum sp.]
MRAVSIPSQKILAGLPDTFDTMNRRTLLRLGGGVLLGTLAGCVGNQTDEFTMRVTSQDIGRTSENKLVLNVTVSNPGNSPQNGTLYVTAELNGRDLVRVRDVHLGAHETTRISIVYDVTVGNVSEFSPRTDLRPVE